MDTERDQERQTYRLCRLGFGILSFSLGVATFSTMLLMARIFLGRGFWPGLVNAPWFHWSDTPVVWGSLVGTYLLWGRWNHASWQRRSGLLVLMGIVDLVLWLLEHGADLGLRTEDIGHQWLRETMGHALGWAEFMLIASLTCEMLMHLGVTQAADTGRATRSLAATGAAIWMLWFYEATNWSGWPLTQKFPTLTTVLLYLGTMMVWSITLIQATALCIATTRQCGVVLAEMEHEDANHDLLKSASEKDTSFLADL